jgi:hypothetical protein
MTRCFDTISNLKKNTVPVLAENKCVIVKGYYKPGDGGGGTFVWDEKSREADNGGTIIAPNVPTPNNNGRWKRLYEDIVSVKWFGAKGDMKATMEEAKGADGKLEKIKGDISMSNNLKLKVSTPGSTVFSNDKDEDEVGKIVVIWDDKMAKRFRTEIVAFLNPSEVTLKDTITAISGINVSWGTDDTDFIQHALDFAKETGVSVYIPPGHYLITKTLDYLTLKGEDTTKENGYTLMKHGLQLFGAGAKVTFIHNQILVKDDSKIEDQPTIRIDGFAEKVDPDRVRKMNMHASFDNTGFLKDFHITSTGQNPKTMGIEMRSAWSYTIENVHIMKMGSHAIRIRNSYDEFLKSSDGDSCDKLHLDNIFAYRNAGWGIIVDAIGPSLSTGRIYIERCMLEANKLGGIQWVGQLGTIENCGLYGNGVYYEKEIFEATKAPVATTIKNSGTNGYGILVKNVQGTPNGLLISRCEIQDNADTQVMIETGSNIRIVQNEFKADNLDRRMTFPLIDIQVGDGNLGDVDTNIQNYDDPTITKIKNIDGTATPQIDLNMPDLTTHQVILLENLSKVTHVYFPVEVLGKWILKNDTNHMINYGKLKASIRTDMGSVLPQSWKLILVRKATGDDPELKELLPRPVNNCVIEDNYSRIIRHDINKFPHLFDVKDLKHTLVKVNANAEGTVIRGWYLAGWRENDKDKLIELVENDPLTHKRVPLDTILYPSRSHINTSLHRDGTDGGHVLLPFASHQVKLPDPLLHLTNEYVPDTSRWGSYRFRLFTEELRMKNPTTRTLGTPLFLEFVNGLNVPINVVFGDDDKGNNDYSITTLTIPRSKIVTGILLFGIASKWTLYSPWTCEGRPLLDPLPEWKL